MKRYCRLNANWQRLPAERGETGGTLICEFSKQHNEGTKRAVTKQMHCFKTAVKLFSMKRTKNYDRITENVKDV